MDDLLEALFCCDIRFTSNQQFDKLYAVALDDVLRKEKTVKTELDPEHWALVETYLGQIQKYHALDSQLEFERGFLIGSRLMLEITTKNIGTERNSKI